MFEIENYDVYVSLDGERNQRMVEVINQFDIKEMKFWNTSLGIREYPSHHTQALKWIFQKGYENCLFIEEDSLIAPSTLRYFENYDYQRDEMLGLMNNGMIGHANIISTEIFMELNTYLKNGDYIGKERIGHNYELVKNDIWDSCYIRFFTDRDYELNPLYSKFNLALDFGVAGQMVKNQRMEDLIFLGQPLDWFQNVLKYRQFLPRPNCLQGRKYIYA